MSLLAEQAKNCSYEGLEDILKSIDKVKLRLKANVNFDLVIELLIMAIKEAMQEKTAVLYLQAAVELEQIEKE